jgi:tryptophan synthase beta chain
VAQAYYNKEFGIKRITTETGAGQWGCALAFALFLLFSPRMQSLYGPHQF